MQPRDLIIQARAGTGKTTTIKKLINQLPKDASVLYLVYNKENQKEAKRDFPKNVESFTSNAFCGQICRETFGSVIENDKTQRLILKNEYPQIEKEKFTKFQSQFIKIVNMCKNYNISPNQIEEIDGVVQQYISENKRQVDRQLLPSPEQIQKVLINSLPNVHVIRGKSRDLIDDFWHLAQSDEVQYPVYEYVFVDEVQDFNMSQMVVLGKMSRQTKCKIVAVGDENQSIYRFRGSTDNPFDELKKQLNDPIIKTLNINYRCAPTIIGYVSNKTENFMYAGLQQEEDQFVKITQRSIVDFIKPNDTILARHNYQLLQTAINLFEKDIPFNICGKCQFGKEFKIYMKLKENNDGVLKDKDQNEIRQWFEMYQERYQLNDEQMMDKIDELTDPKKQRVNLMTIHKSKGLEFQTVVFIDFKIDEQQQYAVYKQDYNCKYIAYTRAKKQLYIIPQSE